MNQRENSDSDSFVDDSEYDSEASGKSSDEGASKSDGKEGSGGEDSDGGPDPAMVIDSDEDWKPKRMTRGATAAAKKADKKRYVFC